MIGGKPERRPSIDPHGYQPIFIDEDYLDEEELKEALLASMRSPCDWERHLTPDELAALETALAAIEKTQSPFIYTPGELPEMAAKRAEFARLGMFRAFARKKYNHGRSIWYGDSLPFRQAECGP